MKQIEVFRRHLSVSIEQLNYAVELITRIHEMGLFKPVDRIVTPNLPGLFDTKLTTSLHGYLQTNLNGLNAFHDFNLRYGVASLLTSIMNDWYLTQSEAGDQLIGLLEEAKSCVDQLLMTGSDWSALVACPADFNRALVYFTHDVFSTSLVPTERRYYYEVADKTPSDQSVTCHADQDEYYDHADGSFGEVPLTELSLFTTLHPIDKLIQDELKLPLGSDLLHQLSTNNIDHNLVEQSTNLEVESQPATPIQSESFSDYNANLDPFTDNKFLKNIAQGAFSVSQKLGDEMCILDTSTDLSKEWVSSALIHSFTVDQFLNRLELSDIDILSSLPWKVVQVCPECFSRSLVERKTETEAGKYYCSACRKRVQVASVPYYEESHTANPHVAITRHRHFLKTRLDEKITDLKWLQQIKVSPGCRKTYFISIDRIEEKTYDQLAAKYEEFYAERSILLPGTKLQIQLCSDGGSVMQTRRLIALINANKNVTHVQGTVLNSAAFDLFFEVQCSKEIAPHASGMYHLGRTVHYVLENGLVPDRKSNSYGTSSLILCYTIGMNTLEIDRIKAGEDVYFDYSRLTEFLERSHRIPDRVPVTTKERYDKDISAIQAKYAD